MPLSIEKNVPEINITKLRVMVYGPPKVGKSTFATQNERAIVIDTDNNGTAFLPCFRVPTFSWTDLKKTLGEIKNDDRFDTIVFDTVDMAYQLCRQHVCGTNGVAHESEDKAFGRLWDLVKTEWMKMVSFVQSMNKGMWMISHSIQKEVKIDGVKRSVVTTTLPGSAQRITMALADQIFYMDTNDSGKRQLYMLPQDGVECGGRLAAFGLNKNIEFGTESELYQKITTTLKGEKE
jgi:hypothetical protein